MKFKVALHESEEGFAVSGELVGTLGARDIKERGHVSPGVAR